MTMSNTFLMYPLNQAFVNRTQSRADDPAMSVVLVILLIFTLPMLGLNGVMLVAWAGQSGAIHPGLIVVTLVTVGVDAVLLAAGWWYRRRWQLAKQGQLIPGKITQVQAEQRGRYTILTVHYQFTSPKSYTTIEDVAATIRDDIKADTLPHIGTPITILYLNDKNYRVM
ncbi:MAG: hypothetical protein Kow00117_16630 [Phototrophicales bacterium]